MPAASWSMLFRGRHAAHTLLLILSLSVSATNVWIVATIMPSVVADLGGAEFYTWPTALYTVASILGTASGRFIRATLGLRRGYMAGVLLFLMGSVGCAVAPHMLVLLGTRTIQGGGAGMLSGLSFAIISAMYPEDLRPRLLSAFAGVWGVAALLGPLLGGVFAELGWWRGAFWVTIPQILVVMGLIWRSLPGESPEGEAPPVPLLRLALLGLGVLCVAGSGHVVPPGMRLALIGSAGVWVVLAFRCDARAAHRLFPSRPLALTTPVGTGFWIEFLFYVTSSQVNGFLPLVVQILHGVSPLGAGYFSVLRPLAWTVSALCIAGLQGRSVRLATLLGPLVVTGGVMGQAAMVVEGPLFLLGGFGVLTGVGYGLCYAHLNSWTMAAARPREEDRTASWIPMGAQLGTAFGAAIAGVVANAAGLAAGVSVSTVAAAATWVYGVSVVAPAAITVLTLRVVWWHQPVWPPFGELSPKVANGTKLV
jgi:MFS family permease